jgi:hypothetical protein
MFLTSGLYIDKNVAVIYTFLLLKGSPGATVKLLPCDNDTMSLSSENSLL